MSRRVASRRRARGTRSRGGHHFLHQWTVTDATADRYRRSADAFVRWTRTARARADTLDQLDELLVDYFHELFEEGKGKSVASTTLFSLIWLMPELRDQLPRAAAAVRGWNKHCPGVSYPPLTWELAIAMAVQLARHGHRRHAAGIVVAFDCLLRVGELVGLRREDVLDDADLRIGVEHRGVMLRLRKTKTGGNKMVTVLDPTAIALVRDLVTHTKPGQRLFPFTTATFRKHFKAVADELGLSTRYVPHSLRHGGATRYFHVMRRSIEWVMERGRWASTKSARIYIQTGAALLASMRAPRRIAQIGAAMARAPLAALRAAFGGRHL